MSFKTIDCQRMILDNRPCDFDLQELYFLVIIGKFVLPLYLRHVQNQGHFECIPI